MLDVLPPERVEVPLEVVVLLVPTALSLLVPTVLLGETTPCENAGYAVASRVGINMMVTAIFINFSFDDVL